jgi:hypothetical protein
MHARVRLGDLRADGRIAQNRVWRDEYSLWGNGYSINPTGHLIMSDYGKSLANQGRYAEAVRMCLLPLCGCAV